MHTLILSWGAWLAAAGAAIGLVVWARLVMDRVEADLREFVGPEFPTAAAKAKFGKI